MPELSTPVRVGGFVAALGLVFATTFAVGAGVGPLDEPAEPTPSAPTPTDTHPGGTDEH